MLFSSSNYQVLLRRTGRVGPARAPAQRAHMGAVIGHASVAGGRSHGRRLLLFTYGCWGIVSAAHLLLCEAAVVTCLVDLWFCNYSPNERKRSSKPLKAAQCLPPLSSSSLQWKKQPPPPPPHHAAERQRAGSQQAEDAEVAFNDPKLFTTVILTSFRCH